MKSALPPVLRKVGHVGTCTIQIYGHRSTKGWRVLLVSGASAEQIGTAKAKDDALQVAEDATLDTPHSTFVLKPQD